MRTTIDIDDSLLARLREDAHGLGIPFRTLLHRVLLRGLEAPTVKTARYAFRPAPLGVVREGGDLVKALSLSDAMADEEIVRELSRRR